METKNCPVCESSFEAYRKGPKFCSPECKQQAKKKITKDCPHCGDAFETFPSIDKKYCSPACRSGFSKQRLDKIRGGVCEVCGDDFVAKRSDGNPRFCSYACRGIWSRKPVVIRRGYRALYMPSYEGRTNKQGYVMEHRYVVEQNLGRLLNDDEVVHHKNEIRSDNRLENLQVMTDSEHKSHHANVRERINGRMV